MLHANLTKMPWKRVGMTIYSILTHHHLKTPAEIERGGCFTSTPHLAKVSKAKLKLLDTHFPKGSPLHKIINRNNVKIFTDAWETLSKKLLPTTRRLSSRTSQVDPLAAIVRDKWALVPLKGTV